MLVTSLFPAVLSAQSVLIALTSVSFLVFLARRRHNLPPGPQGLPFIGLVGQISEDLPAFCVSVGKKFGDVFSLKYGPK